MKIELELPDWCNGPGRLTIFSGHELVAYKYENNPWMIKDQRCVRCGVCCTLAGCEHQYFEAGINGLATCGLEERKPFACCVDSNEESRIKECKITYKEVE